MSDTLSHSDKPDDRAEELLLEFLGFTHSDVDSEFVDFCAEYPDDAAELRRLYSAYNKLDENFGFFGDKAATGGSNYTEGARKGDSIGDFRLIAHIARGGQGEVWEAKQYSMQRRVALKLVLPGRINAKALSLFAREARANGRLNHPGIVAIHGYGEDDGRHWIAQELVEGAWTLRDSLDTMRKASEVPRNYYRSSSKFLAKLADALGAAHAAGIIHRDVKPQNVLITKSNQPKLTDFGLAQITDETGMSNTGDFAGTWLYMSPEQVTAKRIDIDHRTDIFSLGIVMYEMLALQRPFEGDTTHQIAEKIVYWDPPDLMKVRSKVPRDLALICGKALEKRKDDRYATMADFAADLRRWLEHESIHATAPSRMDRAFKWCKRNPTLSLTGGLGGVALIAISWLLGVNLQTNKELKDSQGRLAQSVRELETTNIDLDQSNTDLLATNEKLDSSISELKALNEELDESRQALNAEREELSRANESLEIKKEEALDSARIAELKTKEALDSALLASEKELEAKRQSEDARIAKLLAVDSRDRAELAEKKAANDNYYWTIQAATEAIHSGNRGFARRYLEASPEDHRDWEWGYLDLTCDQSLLRIEAHEDSVFFVDWSPDGERIASGSNDGIFSVWSADSGESLLSVSDLSLQGTPWAWSPDGKYVLTESRDKTLRLRETKTGQSLRAFADHDGSIVTAAWSPDGTRIVTGSSDKSIRIWDPETGQSLRKFGLERHEDWIHSVAWTPDGPRIVTGSFDKSLSIWDGDTGKQIGTLTGHSDLVVCVAWNLDGTRLASASMDHTIRVWNTKTGQILRTLQGHQKAVNSVAWRLDGARLVSGSADGTLRVWDVETGTELRSLDGHTGSVRSVAWSPDGAQVVSGSSDGSLRTWDAGTEKSIQHLARNEASDYAEAIAWSPDETLVASTSSMLGNSFRIRDARTGANRFILRGHDDLVVSVDWNPSGTHIVSGSYDKTLRIWDVTTGESVRTLTGHTEFVHDVGWSPDGSLIASVSEDNTLRVWDANTGESVSVMEGFEESLQSVVWSPDSTRVVSGSGNAIYRIWNVELGISLASFREASESIGCVSWSPDGSQIASASFEGTLRIWDGQTGDQRRAFNDRLSDGSCIAWNPDGSRIVSGARQNTVRVYDVESRNCILPLMEHTSAVIYLHWNATGARLLSGALDGEVIIRESQIEDVLPEWR